MSEQRLTEHLTVSGGVVRCRCGQELGPAGSNFKLGALVRELPLTEANPHVRDPALYIDNKVVFRHFYCPSCATLLQTELAVDDESPQWDIRVEVRE